MHPSSSRGYASEPSPRKNKSQSQREYRSKEMVGFSELRDALLLVDPFDTPLGRDATRHQLLITAAKKLRNLADENQKLVLQLSAAELHEPETTRNPCGTTTQNVAATGIAWSSQGFDVEDLLALASEPMRDYENYPPGWTQSRTPFYGHGHQPYDAALALPYQVPPATAVRGFH